MQKILKATGCFQAFRWGWFSIQGWQRAAKPRKSRLCTFFWTHSSALAVAVVVDVDGMMRRDGRTGADGSSRRTVGRMPPDQGTRVIGPSWLHRGLHHLGSQASPPRRPARVTVAAFCSPPSYQVLSRSRWTKCTARSVLGMQLHAPQSGLAHATNSSILDARVHCFGFLLQHHLCPKSFQCRGAEKADLPNAPMQMPLSVPTSVAFDVQYAI